MSMRPWALVTGASSGLGAEYARQLASSGHNLILVSRDAARLQELALTLESDSRVEVEILVADLHRPADVNKVAARVADPVRAVRVLVNNAGYGIDGHLAVSDADAERNHLAIHVSVPLDLTKAALPGMLTRGSGRIVFVSSVAGYLSRGTYSAHKAWGLTMARSLNATYRARGVHVSAVAPGFTRTEFHQRMNMDISMFPEFMWLQAPRVVRASLSAVERGRAVTIPSLRYKLLVAIAAVLPKKLHQAGA